MKFLLSFFFTILLISLDGCAHHKAVDVNKKSYDSVYVYVSREGVPNQKFVLLLKQDVLYYFKRNHKHAVYLDSIDDVTIPEDSVLLQVYITRMVGGKGVYIDFFLTDHKGNMLLYKENISTSAWKYTTVSNKLASSTYQHVSRRVYLSNYQR